MREPGSEKNNKLRTIGEELATFLRRSKLIESRKDVRAFEEYLQNVTPIEFVDHLTRINGMVRDPKVPLGQRFRDGRGASIGYADDTRVRYLPPDHDDNAMLFSQTLNALKRLTSNVDRALLSYYAIQYIHAFGDGNGRTARLLYHIFAGDLALTPEHLTEYLRHDKPGREGKAPGRALFDKLAMPPALANMYILREVVRNKFSPNFVSEFGIIKVGAPYAVGSDSVEVPPIPGLEAREQEKLTGILNEHLDGFVSFNAVTIARLLAREGNLRQFQLQSPIRAMAHQAPPEDVGKRIFCIDGTAFAASLTAEDARRIFDVHRTLKREHVLMLLDIFLRPNAHLFKLDSGDLMPLKDIFRRVSINS